MDTGLLVTVASTFGVGVLSALVPVVNAELYLAAVVSVASGPGGFLVTTALALGQTVGKVVLFLAARRGRGWALRRAEREGGADDAGGADATGTEPSGTGEPAPAAVTTRTRVTASVRRRTAWLVRRTARPRAVLRVWAARGLEMLDRPLPAAGLLLVSASVGIPPLAATSVAAGLSRTGLLLFTTCTFAGRLVRFAAIAWGGVALRGLAG